RSVGGRESGPRPLPGGRNALRYVEIVTGRARQRGIGGNHEASARKRARTHLGATAFHWNSGDGVGLAASTPRKYGERRRGGSGSTRRTRCAGRRECAGPARTPPRAGLGRGTGPRAPGPIWDVRR